MLRLYRDLKRILVLTENLLYIAGRSLQRRAMRNGLLITLAMSSSIVKTNYLGAQSLTSEQLTALIIGAFASYPAGSVLLRVAGWLTREHIDAAAGGYLHLTSHYKQSRVRLHLHYLWHEVFSISPRAREMESSGADRHVDTVADCPPLKQDEDNLELFVEKPFADVEEKRMHDQFVNVGMAALTTPNPMGVQSSRTGFHLGPVEDWYEKGFFAYEDFPAKAFSRDPLIRRSRRLVEPKARHWLRTVIATEVAPSFWYALTVRRFSSLLGKSLTSLNREAERQGFPDYFDAQHFIWPSRQLDELVAQDFDDRRNDLGARLAALRWGLIREVFSDDGATARRHLMRMFARDYALIFELRLRMDGAWAAGRLNDTPERELDAVEQTFQLSPVAPKRVTGLTRDATIHLGELDRLIEIAGIDHRHNGLRALLEVAAHIDYRDFYTSIVEPADSGAFRQLLESTNDFGKDIGLLRELLRRVRVYHALIKVQIIDYWSIIRQIGKLD